MTTVFVTHDQEEAMDVADRIVVLAGGQDVQVGSPGEIYEQRIRHPTQRTHQIPCAWRDRRGTAGGR